MLITTLLWMFDVVCGCHHQRLSRVFTIRSRTYQVCIECGREFEYSWERMHSIWSNVTAKAYAPLTTVRPAESYVI
jgi:hypothetical protein